MVDGYAVMHVMPALRQNGLGLVIGKCHYTVFLPYGMMPAHWHLQDLHAIVKMNYRSPRVSMRLFRQTATAR